ncbi:MAG: hypothetical protein KF729_29315 [Sandaracinaceae bacterium]|nr:hypothetical protein [Sandaracinaceae bacterium]
MTHFRHALVSTALVVLALSATGCAGGAAWGGALAALLSLSLLFAAGCNQSHSAGDDAGTVARDGGGADGSADAGGYWERCCVDGRIDSCFCPGGHACNYGWFTDCGGGTCSFGPEGCGDAGMPDGGGTWEPCCNDGVIDVCFCPADAECNYGWYTDCGDGTCAYEAGACADGGVATDAGTPDGTWEPCCNDGVIESCFCPAGVACNYGWYTDCGGGTCVGPVETCPAP